MAEREVIREVVSRIRTEFDDTGVREARQAARSLDDDLNKAGGSASAPLKGSNEAWDQWRQHVAAAKTTTQETGAATAETTAAMGSSVLSVATGAVLLGAAYQGVKTALTAYLEAGASGQLQGEQQIRTYRETANALDDIKQKTRDTAAGAGRFLAENVNPFNDDFKKGLISIRDSLNPFESTDTTNARVAADFAKVDAREVSESQAELARSFDEATAAMKRQQAQYAETARASDALEGAQESVVDKQLAYEQSTSALEKAQQHLADAQKKVNEFQADGGRSTDEAIAASKQLRQEQEQLAAAHRAVADAERALADRQDDLATAQLEKGDRSPEAKKAQRALDDANAALVERRQSETDQQSSVDDAQKKLADLTGPAAAKKAMDDLRDAQLGVETQASSTAHAYEAWQSALRVANGDVDTGEQRLRDYKARLGEIGDKVGDPTVSAAIDQLTAKLRNLADIQAAVLASPTLGPLANIDFATGAPKVPLPPVAPGAAPAPEERVGARSSTATAAPATVNLNVNGYTNLPDLSRQVGDHLDWTLRGPR